MDDVPEQDHLIMTGAVREWYRHYNAMWDDEASSVLCDAAIELYNEGCQYNGVDPSVPDSLAETMREVLSRRILVQGFINYDFAGHFDIFLKRSGRACLTEA